MTKPTIIIATTKPWNWQEYHNAAFDESDEYRLVRTPDELTIDLVARTKPRYVFFPHWSWRVPNEILEMTECVCFHMTDLPYGRGGSPLQNLIGRGHKDTMISALRMTNEVDAGPVYMKRPLELSGSAQEIYERAAKIIFPMIVEIIEICPTPVDQQGSETCFERRTPEMSVLPDTNDLSKVYDHIRMLDAETYPHAFCRQGRLTISFSHANMIDDRIEARVVIRKIDDA